MMVTRGYVQEAQECLWKHSMFIRRQKPMWKSVSTGPVLLTEQNTQLEDKFWDWEAGCQGRGQGTGGGIKERLRMCKVLKGQHHALLDSTKTGKLQRIRSIRDKTRWQDCMLQGKLGTRAAGQEGGTCGMQRIDGSNLGRQSKLGRNKEPEKISSGWIMVYIYGMMTQKARKLSRRIGACRKEQEAMWERKVNDIGRRMGVMIGSPGLLGG